MNRPFSFGTKHNGEWAMISIQRYEPGRYLSNAVVHRGIAYLSGLTADNLNQDIQGQTMEALSHVDRALVLTGCQKSKLLRCEVWLADMAHFEAMNDVYCAWLDPGCIPARVCTQARLWDDRCLVEIMATAATGA